MGIGSGSIGLVNTPTIPSYTFFAKLDVLTFLDAYENKSPNLYCYKLG